MRLCIENEPASLPKFRFKTYGHYWAALYAPLLHECRTWYPELLTIYDCLHLALHSIPAIFSCVNLDGEFSVLNKYKICVPLSHLFLSMSSPLSYSVASVSAVGRPHWRNYRRSTLKPTSCCTEPTHCGRNLTVRYVITQKYTQANSQTQI